MQAHCQVEIKRAVAFAKKINSKLYDTSAKEGTGISQLFVDVATKLYEREMRN
jgi:hypothetical protein